MMIRCLTTVFLVVLTVSATSAQEKKTVPPPPKPADEGPSLEVTMKFIQEKFNSAGPVNHIVYYHDNVEDRDWAIKWNIEITRVNADAGACRVDFHRRVEEDESVTENADHSFVLKDVQEIAVMTMEQIKKNAATTHGQPAWSFKVDPPVFVLQVRKQGMKETDEFPLFDEQLANRLAKAMVHAVELCGGGSKPEPF
jgi:hypothetical protein